MLRYQQVSHTDRVVAIAVVEITSRACLTVWTFFLRNSMDLLNRGITLNQTLSSLTSPQKSASDFSS
jgi:hypothetical protein